MNPSYTLLKWLIHATITLCPVVPTSLTVARKLETTRVRHRREFPAVSVLTDQLLVAWGKQLLTSRSWTQNKCARTDGLRWNVPRCRPALHHVTMCADRGEGYVHWSSSYPPSGQYRALSSAKWLPLPSYSLPSSPRGIPTRGCRASPFRAFVPTVFPARNPPRGS